MDSANLLDFLCLRVFAVAVLLLVADARRSHGRQVRAGRLNLRPRRYRLLKSNWLRLHLVHTRGHLNFFPMTAGNTRNGPITAVVESLLGRQVRLTEDIGAFTRGTHESLLPLLYSLGLVEVGALSLMVREALAVDRTLHRMLQRQVSGTRRTVMARLAGAAHSTTCRVLLLRLVVFLLSLLRAIQLRTVLERCQILVVIVLLGGVSTARQVDIGLVQAYARRRAIEDVAETTHGLVRGLRFLVLERLWCRRFV